MEEKYPKLLSELHKLKSCIDGLENEVRDMYEILEKKYHSPDYRNAYYATLNQFDIYIERIVEINCEIEMQPFQEKKDDVQLVLDIPHLPVSTEELFEMTYLDGDSPWNFWLAHTTNVESFRALQTSLLEKMSTGQLEALSVPPIKGDYVYYLERSAVCRGVVTDLLKNRFKIVDIDTSAFKIRPLEKLFKIDSEATTVHAQAMNCFVVECTDDAHLWTGELQRIFASVLKYNKLTVKVINKRCDIIPSFLVSIVAVDSDSSSDCNGCDTVSINEWVCNRIIPELKKNAFDKCELSIFVLDAFYKDNNGNVVHDNNNEEVVEVEVEEKNCNMTSEDEQRDGNKANEFIENKDCISYSDSKPDGTSNIEGDTDGCYTKVDVEKNDVLVTGSLHESSCSNYKDVAKQKRHGVADYLLKTINKTDVDDDDLTIKSGQSSIKSDDRSADGSVHGLRQLGSTEPKVTSVLPATTTTTPNYSISLLSKKELEPLVSAPSSGPGQKYYDNRHNIHQKSVPSNHEASYPSPLTGVPFMMRSGYAGWQKVRYPAAINPYYHPQQHVVPVPPPVNMSYWNSSPPTIPTITNYGPSNYTTWATATDKNTSCSSRNSNQHNFNTSSANRSSLNNVSVNDSTLLTNSNGVSKIIDPVLPPTYAAGYKVKLKHQISLIDPEEEISAKISCVISPEEIYVHLATKNNINIDSLQEDMDHYYSVAEHVLVQNKKAGERNYGRYCAVFCKIQDSYTDDDFRWYRAEVLSWDKDDVEDILVYLVDFGNKVRVGLSQLQPLAPQFGNYYMMAQRCHLFRVKCPEGGWPSSVYKYLNDLLPLYEDYSVTVVPTVSMYNNSLEVVLFKKNDKSTSVNSRIEEFMKMYAEELNNGCDDVQIKEEFFNTMGEDEEHETFMTSNEEEENWDPMKEDYHSDRNNYKVDDEDPCVAVSGYKPKDEERICKFFAKSGYCWKKSCRMEHVQNIDGVFTMDKEEVYQQSFNKISLPATGSVVKFFITNVFNASTFFAQMQGRNTSGENIDEEPETLASLMAQLNKSSSIKEMEDANMPLIEGQLVIAKISVEDKGYWFRARIDEFNDDGTCVVFFVDHGSTNVVFIRNIRAMHPKYLHLPFQAIECTLANVLLKEEEIDNDEPVELLKNLIENKILNGVVHKSFQELQKVEIILEDENGCDVSKSLLDSGYYVSIRRNYGDGSDDDDDDSCNFGLPG